MSYVDKLIEYSEDVISGKVPACQKNKWACQRFLSNLEESRTNEDYPYYFDEERAELFYEWALLFKHTKGILAGKPIELAPVQIFVFGNVYGWYKKSDGYRRFTRFYWQVARKNAKSQSLSLVALYELFVFIGSEVSEVYSAAVKKEQAKIVYDEALNMLRHCDALKTRRDYTTANTRITNVHTGGFMRALSKEDKRTGDGLNPQCGIVDEYHAHDTDEAYNILDSGQGARTQPLLAIITTAGFELNNPCYNVEYDLISKILDPNKPTEIEDYFVMVNELDSNRSDEAIEVNGKTISPGGLIDDISDPKAWEKANPILCSYASGVDKIKSKLAIALEAPEKMRDFMTKIVNVWINERALGFMNMAKWGACGIGKDDDMKKLIKDNTDGRAWVGADLSAKLDLTSITFEFVGNDEKYYVLSHSFIPEDKVAERIQKKDKVPYELWEEQGWLTITSGATVDYRTVKKWALDTAKENEWFIEEFCADPWGMNQMAGDLEDEGVTVVEIRQGPQTLSEPTKNFREMVYSGRVVHENSPVLSWAMGNCVTKMGHNETLLLDKSKAKQRIDPAAATMNSHVRAMIQGQSVSVYEKRGMREL